MSILVDTITAHAFACVSNASSTRVRYETTYLGKLLHKNILLLFLTSDDSNDTPGLSPNGIIGRVLLIVTEAISLLVWVVILAAFAVISCLLCIGKHLLVRMTVIAYFRCEWNQRLYTLYVENICQLITKL